MKRIYNLNVEQLFDLLTSSHAAYFMPGILQLLNDGNTIRLINQMEGFPIESVVEITSEEELNLWFDHDY